MTQVPTPAPLAPPLSSAATLRKYVNNHPVCPI
jgi:hypothetical protein